MTGFGNSNTAIATCHERNSCPKCKAAVGERCKSARGNRVRVGDRLVGADLKHPHRERWEVPSR